MLNNEIVKQWLLTTAIEFPRGLGLILPVVRGEALNLKEVPGCDPKDYAQGLLELFDAGMIRFSSEDPTEGVGTHLEVSNALDRFRSREPDPHYALRRRLSPVSELASAEPTRKRSPQILFELTSVGGNAWERLAEPDWTRFLDLRYDDENGEMVAPDRNHLVARMGWMPELCGVRIRPESVSIDEPNDHPIVYWKRLPSVYRAAFLCEPAEPRWRNRVLEPKWFREWWSDTCRWYKYPWELEGWPSK